MNRLLTEKRRYLTGAVLLLILAALSGIRWRDHVDLRSFAWKEFKYADGVLLPERETEPLVIGKGTKTGFVMTGEPLWLARGSYVIAVSAESEGSFGGSYVQIASDTTLAPDGTQGVVLGRQEFTGGAQDLRFVVTLDQDMTNVRFRLYRTGGEIRIRNIVMRNTCRYADAWLMPLLILLFAAAACVTVFTAKKRSRKEAWELMLVLGFALLATVPYYNDYLIKGHDIAFQLSRIEGMARALGDGVFPVRINPVQNDSYGYASSALYPQLFLYFPAVLRLAGLSLMNAYKILLFVLNTATAVIAWRAFRRMTGDPAAAVTGSALYTLSLYRLSDLYVRAALGEALAMTFLPLLLLGMWEILFEDDRRWPLAALAFTFIFQSHLLTTEIAVMFTVPVCLIFFGRLWREKKRLLHLAEAAVLCLFLNLITLIPMLRFFEEPLEIFGGQNVYLPDRTVYLNQLFSSFIMNTGGNEPLGSIAQEMPLTVGTIPGILLILFAVVRCCMEGKRQSAADMSGYSERLVKMGTAAACLSAAALFLTLWVIPWNWFMQFPLLRRIFTTIQFLWRFLMIAAVCLSLVGAVSVALLRRFFPQYGKKAAVWITAGTVLVACYNIDAASCFETYPNKASIAEMNSTDYNYLYQGDSREEITARGNTVSFSEGTVARVMDFRKEGTTENFFVEMKQMGPDAWIEVPQYYYPGYAARYGDEKLMVSRGDNGVLRIGLPDEIRSDVLFTVRYEGCAAWRAAEWSSCAAVMGWAGIAVWKKIKNRHSSQGASLN